jgi:hypothetical protein
MASPQKHRGCLLWPILNDDTGKVEYWEIHEPCPESHTIQRADGTIEKAEWLDCCHSGMEPAARTTTLTEAKDLTYGIARDTWRMAALERLIGAN